MAYSEPEICVDCDDDLLHDDEIHWCCGEPRCLDCDDDHQDMHDLEDEE